MAYIGKSPFGNAVRTRFFYTASGGETSLSGADSNGKTLSFTDGNYVDVYLNGVLLITGTDYNTSTENTIAGFSALTAGDNVEIVVYETFSLFNSTFNGNVTINEDLTVDTDTLFVDSTNNRVGVGTASPATALDVTGTVTADGGAFSGNVTFGDNNKAIFGAGSDLQIYHDGSHSIIQDSGTGDLILQGGNDLILRETDGSTEYLRANEGAGVQVFHNGSQKLLTTSTGIDVTGTVTADGLTVDTNTLHVDSTNNRVGIGTSSPASKLHVQTASSGATVGGGGDELILENSLTAGLSILSGASSDGNILFGDSGNSAAGYVQYKHGNDALAFGTVATERMRIDSSGNVGIGTSSPAANVHIHEDSSAENYLLITNSATGSASSDGLTIGINSVEEAIVWQRESNNLKFGTNNTERMRIDSSGTVGIGTTAASNARAVITTGGSNGADEVALSLNHGDGGLSVSQQVQLNFGQGGNANTALAQVAAEYRGGTFDGALSFKTNKGSTGNLNERMRVTANEGITISPAGTVMYLPTVFARNFGTQSTGSWVDVARLDARFPYEITMVNVGGNTAPRSWCIHLSKDWGNPGYISVDIQSRLNSGQVIFDAVRVRGWQGASIGNGPVVLQVKTDTLYSSGNTYYFSVRPLCIGDVFMDDLATLNGDTASNIVTAGVSLN